MAQINPRTEIGSVRLAVKNLESTSQFYQNAIGLSLLDRDENSANLGVENRALVKLEYKPDGRSYPTSTGLFHLAILVPSRIDLGSWLIHFSENGYRLDGVGDHLVSEALYLTDNEGNGIEIYRDRPRSTWEVRDGKIKMDTLAVDLDSMIKESAGHRFEGMPKGTKVGHIHLQVDDTEKSANFYKDILGFDLVAQMPGARFLSAGGYHHHIGMNIWRSRGAESPPKDSLGLVEYEIKIVNHEDMENILDRLSKQPSYFEQENSSVRFQDPAGIWVKLVLDR